MSITGAEAFDHLVETAQVFVGVGGEHNVADPVDIVGIAEPSAAA
jgi:hypothetical protein